MTRISKLRALLLALFGLGLLVIAAGFLYDLAFAGIPYQDPPAELQAQYEADQDFAVFIMKLGAYIAGPGFCLLLVSLVVRTKTKRP